jgi:hypothetical protein
MDTDLVPRLAENWRHIAIVAKCRGRICGHRNGFSSLQPDRLFPCHYDEFDAGSRPPAVAGWNEVPAANRTGVEMSLDAARTVRDADKVASLSDETVDYKCFVLR